MLVFLSVDGAHSWHQFQQRGDNQREACFPDSDLLLVAAWKCSARRRESVGERGEARGMNEYPPSRWQVRHHPCAAALVTMSLLVPPAMNVLFPILPTCCPYPPRMLTGASTHRRVTASAAPHPHQAPRSSPPRHGNPDRSYPISQPHRQTLCNAHPSKLCLSHVRHDSWSMPRTWVAR